MNLIVDGEPERSQLDAYQGVIVPMTGDGSRRCWMFVTSHALAAEIGTEEKTLQAERATCQFSKITSGRLKTSPTRNSAAARWYPTATGRDFRSSWFNRLICRYRWRNPNQAARAVITTTCE